MEIATIVMLFFFRTAVIAFVFSQLQLYLLPESTPTRVRELRWPISIVTAFFAYLVDQVFIYPKYRGPYRDLPSVKKPHQARILFESPRGKTPLAWMRAHPDADVIRSDGAFNLSTLIPASAEALRDLLNTNSYDFQKPWGLRSFLARALGFGLILSEGEDHKHQRKMLTPAFNIRHIRELYGLMWSKTQILLAELDKDVERNSLGDGYGRVEMTSWAGRLTLDIIGPTAMGRDFQSLQIHDQPMAKAFDELLEPRLDGLVFLGAHFVFPEWILRRVPAKVNRDIDRLTNYIREQCAVFVRDKKTMLLKGTALDNTDILGSIIGSSGFSDELLVDEMMTFLAAGHETTANALTWACYLCAFNPSVQEKLREEIRSAIPSATSPISYETLENMPYLNGVCEETLRLYPTVPVTVREAIRDTNVAGVAVTKGTQFVLIPYAINRHPRFWGDNADQMIPERWIDTDKNGVQRPNKHGGTNTNFSVITFLHGPRACIGRDFAKAELRCAVAGVLGRYQIVPDTNKKPKITGIITMRAVGGVHLRLKRLEGW